MRTDNADGARLSVADRPHGGATVDQSHGSGGRGLGARQRSLHFRFLDAVGGLSRNPGTTIAQSSRIDTNVRRRRTDS